MQRFGSGALFVAIAAFAAILFAGSHNAEARPAVCAKLERQLAVAGSGSGNAKFSGAARAQAQQLQIARGQARRAGCSGSFFSGGDNRAYCTRINSTIRRMEANLAKLQNRAANDSGSLSRARIRAALEANDCYRQPEAEVAARRTLPAPVRRQEPGLLTMLFGGQEGRRVIEVPLEDGDNSDRKREIRRVKVTEGNGGHAYPGPGGTFRTLCVRTCDGYYFPVSFSTTSSRFSTDEKACAALCPGTETRLYFHSVPDQEPEEMVSLDREPYMNLPTAFAYRVKGINATPGCTCQATGSEAKANSDGESDRKRQAWIPLPAAKPDLVEDSETALNREGGLGAAEIRGLVETKSAPADSASRRKIRVVGPEFLPAQSRAEATPVPGRVTVQ